MNRDTWVPIESEHRIICNFLKCAGGMGLTGNGHCFLAGNPYDRNCKEFISDEDFEREQLKEAINE